jgi:hypothetical protein
VNHATRGVLLAGTLFAVAAVVLAVALAWSSNHPNCRTGFPTLISCTFTW